MAIGTKPETVAQSGFGYDKDTDYSKLMEEAAADGDYVRAAIYEAQRNEKIAGEGLNYQTSAKYANFLPGSEADKQGYVNPYKDQVDAAIAALDPEEYKKFYLSEADRTMKDTLGSYSGMTGGIPSTAAVAAASQAADYQKSQLGAKLVDLNAQRANLLMNAGGLDANNYQMNINNALNRWTMLGYADNEVAGILGVPVGTSTADQAYTNWTKGQQGQQNAQSTIGALIEYGIMPTQEQIEASGLPYDLVMAMYYDKNPVQSGYAGGTYYGQVNSYGDGMNQDEYLWLTGEVLKRYMEGDNKGGDALMAQYSSQMNEQQAKDILNNIAKYNKP